MKSFNLAMRYFFLAKWSSHCFSHNMKLIFICKTPGTASKFFLPLIMWLFQNIAYPRYSVNVCQVCEYTVSGCNSKELFPVKSYYLMDSLPRRWCLCMRNDVLGGHIHCHIWSYQKSLWYWETFRPGWWINVGFRAFHFPWQQKLSVLSFEVTDLLQGNSQPQAQDWIAFVFSASHALKRHGIAWGRGLA